jgi:hypothetical protein
VKASVEEAIYHPYLRNFKYNPIATEFTDPANWHREWNYSFVPLEVSTDVSNKECSVSKYKINNFRRISST